jgi:hypothetical protein
MVPCRAYHWPRVCKAKPRRANGNLGLILLIKDVALLSISGCRILIPSNPPWFLARFYLKGKLSACTEQLVNCKWGRVQRCVMALGESWNDGGLPRLPRLHTAYRMFCFEVLGRSWVIDVNVNASRT